MLQDLSIYIHYPFCKAKCPYCDFNSHVKDGVDFQAFLQAYKNELNFFAAKIGQRKVKTIFFGGGTPSLMPIFLVEGILKEISNLWLIDENCEITLEANPTSFESAKFKDLRHAGINRLSIGIQALNDQDLKFLGRQHSSTEAIATIEVAAKIFDNFSFDLIYARPLQTLKDWQIELKRAIDFGTKHLSLYQLTIEKGTKFFSDFKQKKFEMPDEELSVNFYELTDEITAINGFKAYEISNYAKNNFESRHNLAYWLGKDYIGIGAGAHSRIYFENEKNRREIMMIHEPLNWLNKTKDVGNGIQVNKEILAQELLEELILMGLRLEDGISSQIFKTHFNKNIDQIFDFNKLKTLENQGLIIVSGDGIKITKSRRILTNVIIEKLCHTLFQI